MVITLSRFALSKIPTVVGILQADSTGVLHLL